MIKTLFGIWSIAVGLAVGAVAAYYSIVGLTAIFAAAVIPVIIMGAVLELGKFTAAIWLHSFWHQAAFLTKAYLTSAVIVLMFITSMGIFGFLSKAHIEQSANSGGLVAQIERVDQEILREEQAIARAITTIEGYGQLVSTTDTGIQARIATQERIVSDISQRLAGDISTQNQLISQNNRLLAPLEQEFARIDERRSELESARNAGNVIALQMLVGADTDGVLGPRTQQLIVNFEESMDARRSEILEQLTQLQNTDDPIVTAAQAEISRLQQTANAEIARAQDAINSFRNQLVAVTTVDNSSLIAARNTEITTANLRIDELLDNKFALQADLRILQVEVGPVRYVAQLVYDDTSQEVLEQAVRWVIIIIVFVFDPLAIVLVLAGLSVIHGKPIDIMDDLPHNEPSSSDNMSPRLPGGRDDTNDPNSERLFKVDPESTLPASDVVHAVTPIKTPTQKAPQGQVVVNGRSHKSNRGTNAE